LDLKNKNRIIFTSVRIGVAAGLILYLGTSGMIRWTSLLNLLPAWPLMSFAFLLFFGEVVVSGLRLIILLRAHRIFLSLSSAIRLTSIGIFFNIAMPGATGGDLVKIYYVIRGSDISRTKVTTIVLLDRIAGIFALMILPLLIAPFFLKTILASDILITLILIALCCSLILVASMLIAFSEQVNNARFLIWLFKRPLLGKYLKWVFDTIHIYRNQKMSLLTAVLLSLIIHIANLFVILLITISIAPGSFSWLLMIVAPMGFIANALPLTPGGLGVGEAAFSSLFNIVGLNYGAEVLLGWRIIMALVGLIGLYFYLKGRHQYIHQLSAPTVSLGADK